MTDLRTTVTATLTKTGDGLTGVIPRPGKPAAGAPKPVLPREWDIGLAAHVPTMTDGDTVDVEVDVDIATGVRVVRLTGVAGLPAPTPVEGRAEALRGGGFVNPYTFVPTPPRDDLDGTGLEDGPPPGHDRHRDGRWSGTLAITLTTVTPLVLPVRAADQPDHGPTVYDVRVGPDGRPAVHGASFKGALRSAFETITASRYGVFFEHHDRLAYRVPAGGALDLTPARVYRQSGGAAVFRLCRGDATWTATGQGGNQVQDAAWIPAYTQRPSLERIGGLAAGKLTDHHGKKVHARVVLYQYERVSASGRSTRFQVWRATHLAGTGTQLTARLRDRPAAVPHRAGKITPVEGTEPRIVQGWLSATGYSIKNKHDERLFVETPDRPDIPVDDAHLAFWQSVLRAYDLAQGYNDPNATYSRTPTAAGTIERSRHVPSSPDLRGLPDGTLVYVKHHPATNTISEVHPVMIGRMPFTAAPAAILPDNLRPAEDRHLLSPADRLFGWVPAGRRDDGDDTNDGASGYRGHLRVRSVTCRTDDWRPAAFPAGGVTLAPLSSPKPTQFRFYASPDRFGQPMGRQAAKTEGYAENGGLRGRKMYRWRHESPTYWQPPADRDDPDRGYLALTDHREHPDQLGRHRGWVRPGVTFDVVLFLDAVPEAELGALLWLLTRGDTAPVRLGAGKPYGFGVLTTNLDPSNTRLWDADGIRAGWLRLTRPDPVDTDRLSDLAERFAATARAHPVLHEATESYLAAARPVTDPVHYPRKSTDPESENYLWFVANEKPSSKTIIDGWALPHVRDPEQRLPYLDSESRPTNASASGQPPRPRTGQNTDRPNATGNQGARGRRSH